MIIYVAEKDLKNQDNMKKKKSNYKKYKFTYIKTTLITLFFSLFFLNGYVSFEKTGDNFFHIFLNGQEVGTVGDAAEAEELLVQARREIALKTDALLFMEANLEVQGEEVVWGRLDSADTVLENMTAVLKKKYFTDHAPLLYGKGK